ncbi:CLUMA_CG002760, isoform A [Clunio marinus]|uniref:CLUMA_CG002760, isoform A n=1 Tax=Clunio marinus TaxID=568069 RepID=A0A1J1HM52_9DIPT|nr:CLUMA_CG002760, isoform A [Clunio marinus]
MEKCSYTCEGVEKATNVLVIRRHSHSLTVVFSYSFLFTMTIRYYSDSPTQCAFLLKAKYNRSFKA